LVEVVEEHMWLVEVEEERMWLVVGRKWWVVGHKCEWLAGMEK
jgi:hypothetical protein